MHRLIFLYELKTNPIRGLTKSYHSLPTINGVAKVIDVKRLIQELDESGNECSVYIQELNITNDSTNANNVTTRYFMPFEGEVNATSKIAGGNKKNEH